MKYVLLFLTLTFTSTILSAQTEDWFPIGATWTYNYLANPPLGPAENHLVQYTITEQTVLNGQACAKMEAIGDDPNPLDCNANPAPYYFYESNDSIFYASDYDNTFRLAYDFGAEDGDAWEFVYPVEMYGDQTVYSVTVNNVSTIQQDGQELKVMDLGYEIVSGEDYSQIGYQEITIIEKIGATILFYVPFGYWSICENHFNTALQCYNDETISYIGEGFNSCTLGLNDADIQNQFQISPNPAKDFFMVNSSENGAVEIKMYSITGQLIYSGNILNQELKVNISGFSPGLYILQIQTEDVEIYKKIVLE